MNNVGVRLAIFGVIVVGVIGYRILFVDSDEVRHFSDELVEVVGQADGRFGPIGVHLDAYRAGDQVDVNQMEQVRSQLEAGIRQDREKLKKIEVPDDDLCREFHAACLKYIDSSLQFAEKYKETIAYITEHNPGTQEDIAAVNAPLVELAAGDEQLLQAAQASQQRLAKKYDFKVK